MTHGYVPSVADIRVALDDIPGTARDEPLPEVVRDGLHLLPRGGHTTGPEGSAVTKEAVAARSTRKGSC